MNEYYGNNDWRDYLAHSWGKKPEQKAREKEYNAWYYKTHKEEIMRKRGQKGKRPLARETNVTGKGKVERRGEGLNESKLSDENKKVYDKTLTEFVEEYKNGYRLEDPQDLQVALWENGWKGSFEDLEKEVQALYKKLMDDFKKTNKADKKEQTGNKLDKPSNPKGKIGKTISKKLVENFNGATNARGIKNVLKETGKMVRDEDGDIRDLSSKYGGSAQVGDAYDRMHKFSPAKALTKRKKKKED